MPWSTRRAAGAVAAAEGQARKADFGVGGLGVVGLGVGVGGYSSTDEGKMIAASFRDNYNEIVRKVRANPALAKSSAPRAGAVFN